jgi:hypothetical protein
MNESELKEEVLNLFKNNNNNMIKEEEDKEENIDLNKLFKNKQYNQMFYYINQSNEKMKIIFNDNNKTIDQIQLNEEKQEEE